VVGFHLNLIGFLMDALHPMAPTPVTNSTGKTSDPKPQWDFFTYSWQQYKSLANMDGSVNDRLGACLGACKGDMGATKIFPKLGDEFYNELAEVEMMQETRQLVVKIRNRLAHRLKIGVMAQGLDEMITSFEMRFKQVARLGGFQV
jgi:hypothetical protein